MSRIERLAALSTVTYAVTRWVQTSTRALAAMAALRGHTVVYRATFDRGTLTFDGYGHRAVVADSVFLAPPENGHHMAWTAS